MPEPRATIVIPLLRQRDAWLNQAVRSAAAQTVPCEVIVVTSRETPQSNREVLSGARQEHANVRVLFRDLPRGFPGTLNFGIRSARTNRIGVLLSDDWLAPDCLAECLTRDEDIVSTGRTTFLADGVTVLESAARESRMADFLARPTLEARARYLTHFFLFQAIALKRAGYVDETVGDYPGIDDYHLIWTMLEEGATVGIVERRLYNYRDHDGERLTLANAQQAVHNLKKILRKHGVTEPDFSRLVASHQRWYGKPLYQVLGDEVATSGLIGAGDASVR